MIHHRHLLILLSSALPALAQAPNPNRVPDASEQSAALSAIREYALNYTQRLPNYTCTQVKRWVTIPARIAFGAQASHTEVVEAQISMVNHEEVEKITTINGQPAVSANPKDVSAGYSRGEFGNLLDRIFDPQTSTQFRWDRWATRDGRRQYVFSYVVPQPMGYAIQERDQTLLVAFKGVVYADVETKAVMRIEAQGFGFPAGSNYRSMTLKLNYKRTHVADKEFTLPSDFVLSYFLRSGTTEASAVYKDYHRFLADVTIQFPDSAH